MRDALVTGTETVAPATRQRLPAVPRWRSTFYTMLSGAVLLIAAMAIHDLISKGASSPSL